MPIAHLPRSDDRFIFARRTIIHFSSAITTVVLLCSSCATPTPSASTGSNTPPSLSIGRNAEEQAQFDLQLRRYPALVDTKAPASGFSPSVVMKVGIPLYPYEMSKAHQTGQVWFEIYVEPNGEVHEARILKSTNRAFEEPAITALKQFKFRPALLDGNPVRSGPLRSVMEFNLD